jgi:hypothetical protein
VQQDEVAILGSPEIHLGQIGFERDGRFDPAQGILRRMSGGAAMADF